MMNMLSTKIHTIKKLALFVFVSMVAAYSLLAKASIDVYEFEDDAKRAEFVSLTKELRCPKCQNQDIADSNAPIAADMRKEVHRLLEDGHDHESIVNHMIERFGDFVTYKPKVSAETFMLWYGPWLFVGIGLVIIGTMIRLNKSSRQEKKNKAGTDKQGTQSADLKRILAKYDDDGDSKD